MDTVLATNFALAALLGGLIWFGLGTATAVAPPYRSFDRDTSPWGFWLTIAAEAALLAVGIYSIVERIVAYGSLRPVAAIRWLRDDPVMQMVSLLVVTMGLLVCTLVYCGKRIMVDVRHARSTEIAWGAMALSGSALALVSMVWATLASLAHL